MTVFVIALWINSWINIHDLWTQHTQNLVGSVMAQHRYPGLVPWYLFHYGDKAFSKLLLGLAVGDDVEFFSLQSARCGSPRLRN